MSKPKPGESGELIAIDVTHILSAAPEAAFDAWLTADQAREWMGMALKDMGLEGRMNRVEIEPEKDGAFLFSDLREGVEHEHWGNYLEIVRPHRLVFTWNTVGFDETDPCTVTLSFDAREDGTVVTVSTEMQEKWADAADVTRNGWLGMLKAQDKLLQSS